MDRNEKPVQDAADFDDALSDEALDRDTAASATRCVGCCTPLRPEIDG